MQSGGYKQRNRRRGGGCSLQNFPVNTTTESFLSSLAIPFSPSCSFCSGAIFWHLPSSLRSWPGGESMKGIRYYYTACLPPAYRKGGRSSSLIGSQFFWAAWNGGSGVEKACEIMGSPRTRPGPLRRSRGRSREHLPPSTLGPNQRASPNMPPTLDAERGAETICGANLSLRGKSREAREYRLAYIGAPALTSPSRGVPWRREIARLLHAASDCYSARVIRGPETGGCILEGRREGGLWALLYAYSGDGEKILKIRNCICRRRAET